jgi:hypothetical protein
MTTGEHYSVVRWYDGAAWVDVSAEVASCVVSLTRGTRELYTLSNADPLVALGGRTIRLTMRVVRETVVGFYRGLLDAEAAGSTISLELYQPDMTAGSRKASGTFVIRQIAPLEGDAGDGMTGMVQVELRGGRGFVQTTL